jgi:transcriptional regulator with XRE-family HTH domain
MTPAGWPAAEPGAVPGDRPVAVARYRRTLIGVGELEQRWNDLGGFIRDQRRQAELSVRKLSERAGVSNPYLSQVERGLRKPSAEILQRLAKALEISAETLYVRAGILDEPTEGAGGGDLVTHIESDRWLTAEQKRTLAHIYQSFRSANTDGGEDVHDANHGDDDSDSDTAA